MDPLVEYIITRKQKHGHIDVSKSISSVYFTIGEKVIRISDHMRYGLSNQGDFDYSFVIQPGDLYIFAENPKNNGQQKMYLKIVSLKEAQKLIRDIHAMTITHYKITARYEPKCWKTSDYIMGLISEKLTWDDFKKKYIDEIDQNKSIYIVDYFDTLNGRSPRKGTIESKLPVTEKMYETLSPSQYERLIEKAEDILAK